MPAVDTGGAKTGGPRKRLQPKPKPAPSAPPRNADTGDTSRSRPAPKQTVSPVFRGPQTATRVFAPQQAQAQQKVRQSRRALPAPTLAQPPIISAPAGATTKPSGAPLPRAQVDAFLRSQSKVTQAARHQIVGSIREQLGNARGQDRIDRIDQLMDDIATDPRLARTRQAIRHYTALERQTARPNRDEARPGPQPRRAGIGPASINLTAVSQALATAGAKVAPGLQGHTPERQIAKNALSDFEHLPLMIPQTAYEVAAASKEAAGGDATRAKRLAKSLTEGVYGHLARGDVDGAIQFFRDHPVYAVLEVRGGKGFIGRGIGAGLRSGTFGERAARAASTSRRDVRLSGAGARVADRQHYSPDVFTKLFQVAVTDRTPKLRAHRLRRRADMESDMAAASSRAVRIDEARQAQDVKPSGPLDAVVGLAVQGVVRPASLEADLRKEVARLDHAHAHAEFSTGAQKRQNRATADAIRKVLDSPRAMARLGEIAQSGRANVRAINELERRGEGLNASVPARNERAKLFPAAQAHLGAKYGDAPFRAARAREVAAGRALRSERTRLSQRVAQARQTEQAAVERVRTLATVHKSERGKEAHHGPVAAYYFERGHVAYHGSTAHPDVVLKEGLKPSGPRSGVFLTDSIASARAYGAHTYEIDTRRVGSFSHDPEAAALGARFTTEHIPASAIRKVDLAGDFNGVRQAAIQGAHGRRFTTRQEAVAFAKAHGIPLRDIARIALTPGEAKRVGQLSTARRAVQGATQHRRQAEADLRALNKRGAAAVPARAAFEAARSERQAAGRHGTQSLHTVDAAGNARRLTDADIRAIPGLEDVAYLPHHTNVRGARAYYQTSFAGRKTVDSSKKRTGAAFEKGTVDQSYQAIAEHRIRVRGVLNRIAEHDRIIHSIAVTLPKTGKNPHGLMTWDQAEKIAENAADQGVKLVPYRAVPGSYDRARMSAILNGQGIPEMTGLEDLVGHEFADRLKEPTDKTTPNVVLVPAEIINQLQAQSKATSSVGAAGNVAADVFRRVVLPFSSKWIAGNIIEAGLRLGVVGAGPNAARIGYKLMQELEKIDAEQALRVKASLTGGLLFGNRGLTVRRVSEHFAGTALEMPAALIGTAGHLPVVHELGQLIKGYTDGVFAFNRAIESTAQHAALGKWAKREMQEMTGSWAKATRAQEAALQDVARGLTDTKNIHDAARYIDQTLGQYSRFSPGMRRFIQSAAPFLPWYLNSVRFVFWTLPAHHPIKTGIAALAAQNLQADYDASHDNLPPGDLRGEVVTDNGTVLPVARYTPFGAFGTVLGGGNEQLTPLIDPLFPQFKSAALAAWGLNFAGRPAKIDPRDRTSAGVPGAVRLTMALNSLLEAFVPVLGIGKRVREGGETGWDNSTIFSPKTKPGTRVPGGAANRILNPFRPVSGIRGGATVTQTRPTRPAPTATPAPPSVEDDLWDNLDNSQGDDAAQQQLEQDLWDNLDGG